MPMQSMGTPRAQNAPHSPLSQIQAPAEPQARKSQQAGKCDNCGNPARRLPDGTRSHYCSNECRTAFRNFCKGRAFRVLPLLMKWRKHYGRKGTPGEGLFSQITQITDEINRELKERQAQND